MNVHLLLHNFFYLFTIILSIFVVILLLFKTGRKVEKVTLILALLGVVVFVSSHVLGVSVRDSELSRKILMFNTVDIFLPIFTGHCVLAFIKKTKEQKSFIIFSYVIGFGLLLFFILNPHNFLLTSIPKMYFPNYYVPGPYYFIMLIFFFFLIAYTFFIMRRAYIEADEIDKNRIKYFATALFLGYTVGSINFLLVYDILVDPLWGFLFIPLFSIPFAYAVINYELMDIKIVAKRAFVYIMVSIIFAFILISLNYLNSLIIKTNTNFPIWVSSLILSFLISIGLILVWRKIKETDTLKYEFINIISHKFRTPLTSIKWSSDNLMDNIPSELKDDVINIDHAANNLVDLTNMLVGLSDDNKKVFEYNFTKIDINDIIKNIILEYSSKIKIKNITINTLPESKNFVFGDKDKLKFVFQTLIYNAISYNKNGGYIFLEISTTDNQCMVIEIKDTGIGINNQDIKYVFSKFYRTDSSRAKDTEGMGIGLYLTKSILEKHHGKIWVKSDGVDKGSSFFISLPIYNK